jgi:hypothetical protein
MEKTIKKMGTLSGKARRFDESDRYKPWRTQWLQWHPIKASRRNAGSVHFSRYLIIAQKAMTENKK